MASKEESILEITDVRVRKVTKEGKMKAIVSVTFDNEFVVHDIKVIEGDRGMFIAMPSRRAQSEEFRDVAHPINSHTRDKIQNAVLEKYELALMADDLIDNERGAVAVLDASQDDMLDNQDE